MSCRVDAYGCTYCPEVPEIPGIPAHIIYEPVIGWNAGANSIDALDMDLLLTFTMPEPVFGAVVGFKASRRGVGIPERVTHGFVFSRATSALNLYGVVERGVNIIVSQPRAVGLDEVFKIQRRRNVVTYLVDDVPIHTSSFFSSGTTLVSGCLYSSGDSIG